MVFSHIYETRSPHNIKTLMPFFSKNIVEFSLSVSSDYKLRDGYDRAYFRDAMKESVPSVILKKLLKQICHQWEYWILIPKEFSHGLSSKR